VISPELEAQILRLAQVEKWPIGTIAAQLGVHHDVVARVLRQAGFPVAAIVRPSRVDRFVPFIRETWEKYPRLTASRLYQMCRERGYVGHPDHFRHAVARWRVRPRAEPFLRLRTLPGEEGQVDWAHFGHVQVGRAKRPLMAFVLVLSFSRAIFLRFMLGMRTSDFLLGHVEAFSFLAGVPRVLKYDNLKSAVLERVGAAIRFNPILLGFAAHHGYEPRPVAVARGNEKGRVERSIRYVRGAFYEARPWRDLDDLNAQARTWCLGEAMDRKCPGDEQLTVREALAKEQSLLRPLPANPFPIEERQEVSVGKTPYVRFDGNDYSVPHSYVRRTLFLLATQEEVRILDGATEIARHRRSYDTHAQVEDPAHIQALLEYKRRAKGARGVDHLAHAAPASRVLLGRLAERGKNLGYATFFLLRLLSIYGAEALEGAILEVLRRDAPHIHAVRQVLEMRHAAKGRPPALDLTLPEGTPGGDLTVRPHDLKTYDDLAGDEHKKGEADGTQPQG
jgi:transposase